MTSYLSAYVYVRCTMVVELSPDAPTWNSRTLHPDVFSHFFPVFTSYVGLFRKVPFLGRLCALQPPWGQEHSLYALRHVRAVSSRGF